jgi:hypothetical protein
MPNCPNDHTDVWDLNCQECKTDVPYDQMIKELQLLPEVEVSFEDLTILFVGCKSINLGGAYVSEITVGSDGTSTNRLTLNRIEGGTWHDYDKKYSETITNWLARVGFKYSKYKILVVNTLNPLSIPVIDSPLIDEGVIVLAITADKTSTPLYKNTSYVALRKAYSKKLSVVLIEDHYFKNLSYFDENSGLVVGEPAFQNIIANIMRDVQGLTHFIEGDKRLGIMTHSMSSLLSASDQVYKDMDTIFEIQSYMKSVEDAEGNYQSIHLLGQSPRELHNKIQEAFKNFSAGFDDLLTSEIIINEKASHYDFYDLYLLYGVEEDPVLKKIESGYRSVAKKNPAMSLEAK